MYNYLIIKSRPEFDFDLFLKRESSTGSTVIQYGERIAILTTDKEIKNTLQNQVSVFTVDEDIPCELLDGFSETELFGINSFFHLAFEVQEKFADSFSQEAVLYDCIFSRGSVQAPKYMAGKVMIGVVFVNGLDPKLKFTQDEINYAGSRIASASRWWHDQNPLSFLYITKDEKSVTISAPSDNTKTDIDSFRNQWLEPALLSLGCKQSYPQNIEEYLNKLSGLKVWTYVIFFSKYDFFNPDPKIKNHFSPYYSFPEYSYVVIYYQALTDPWYKADLERILLHETAHIFGVDGEEYNGANRCSCSVDFGRWKQPNKNCIECFPQGVKANLCIMQNGIDPRTNIGKTLCPWTRFHVGWLPLPIIAKHSGKAMTLTSGNKLVQYKYQGAANQLFWLRRTSSGKISIISQQTGNVLTASSIGNQISQEIEPDILNPTQEFEVLLNPLSFNINCKTKDVNGCFDVKDNSIDDDAEIILWEWKGRENQLWRIATPIILKLSKQCISINPHKPQFQKTFGSDYFPFHNGITSNASQLFYFERVPGTTHGFYIVNLETKKVLDVEGASTSDGAYIIQYNKQSGAKNQEFTFEVTYEGFFVIKASHSGKCITLDENGFFTQCEYKGNGTQEFWICMGLGQ